MIRLNGVVFGEHSRAQSLHVALFGTQSLQQEAKVDVCLPSSLADLFAPLQVTFLMIQGHSAKSCQLLEGTYKQLQLPESLSHHLDVHDPADVGAMPVATRSQNFLETSDF